MNNLYKNYMMKKGGKWIQSAIKKPGSFTKQAQAAGMSVPAFREKVLANKEDYSGTTVKRANLAKTLSKMKKGQGGMEFKDPMGPDRIMGEAEMVDNDSLVGSEFEVAPSIQALDPNLDFARQDIASLEKQAERDNVKAYQRMLNQKYGAGLSEDGAWGPKTQAAYEKFIMAKKAAPASKEPNPMTKNPERDLPNFERMSPIEIKAKKKAEPITLLPKRPIPQIQPTMSNFMNSPAAKFNSRSYSDNTRVAPAARPMTRTAPAAKPANRFDRTTIGPTPNGYRSVLYDQFLQRNKLK